MGVTCRRTSTIAAVALVCALSLLSAPGSAMAAPPAGPLAAPHDRPDDPKPGKRDLSEVREELDDLYHEAAVATDAYNAAEEEAKKQSDQIVKLANKIQDLQEKRDALKDRAGAAARAQYRSGGVPPQAQLVLSDNPEEFLDGAQRVRQSQHATTNLIGELGTTQEDLQLYAKDAGQYWLELDQHTKDQAKRKKKIEAKIKAAEKLEKELEKEERERLLQMEQDAEIQAQTAWLDTGILKDIKSNASAQGKKAVAFATKQIGKPYVWGAEGPSSYDCSGLTSKAWAAAGRGIPRTSQEQWRQLPRIAVRDMRPGDLIIYQADASHVGMYIGNGAIVHAPRPGRDVTVAGAGSMPILGVVRPDK
ncbi:C40 family peptidase [Streptomyces sp. TRM66268-LWL]|uniref:C40 family peptidase n=1 Tax=Streptomyces polyasparticus TaxID=2767826 RepID=A0ABR7SM95_9ACTN|nr:C40 family peptidase [Streptomyces polyasparticus]MBC9716610.1 C40 family peptidase [Streptomyces polyasparticus]